ncbi:hypothetical protein BS50DRAFT_575847 [Corynespora cassiicola Philippines]|uniref:Uncharacterized protein n=1 Tax=Corynespora cassiicola Philippines TaxID=1448308 RepID=A0A2T2NG32_CORCC|nr:hypothetical protein BS50DRAFT_575847 [Corynespora cassiicola Philippines]
METCTTSNLHRTHQTPPISRCDPQRYPIQTVRNAPSFHSAPPERPGNPHGREGTAPRPHHASQHPNHPSSIQHAPSPAIAPPS